MVLILYHNITFCIQMSLLKYVLQLQLCLLFHCDPFLGENDALVRSLLSASSALFHSLLRVSINDKDVKVNIFDMAGHPVFYEVHINTNFINLFISVPKN